MNTQNNNQNNTENTEETRFKKMKKPEMIKLIKSLEKDLIQEKEFTATEENEKEILTEENDKLKEEIKILNDVDNDEKYDIMISEKNAEIQKLRESLNKNDEELQQVKRNLDATEDMLDNVNDELKSEKSRHEVHKKLVVDYKYENDALSDKLEKVSDELEKAKEKGVRKKREIVIEYIETKEFNIQVSDSDYSKGYLPDDAFTYITHMKIKDEKLKAEIHIAYHTKSVYLCDLYTETKEDEKWIIKKTSRASTTKTEEEIKKQEENIDFNTNCQSCIYNGKGYSMRPCKKEGILMRGTHRICKAHNKNADQHLAKYIGFTVEMGTHLGWYGETETYHQEKGRGIKPDFVKPSRK